MVLEYQNEGWVSLDNVFFTARDCGNGITYHGISTGFCQTAQVLTNYLQSHIRLSQHKNTRPKLEAPTGFLSIVWEVDNGT